ncbi:MAG: protein-L-isoaspartate(D-aspartate) O-methyltransferase [Nitrospinae bacterium]|nr:protein-L-isoaspartate(D-aspartate) O-methyltransferase [Nitrospinota bacterium]
MGRFFSQWLILFFSVLLLAPPASRAADYAAERNDMVESQIVGRGVRDPRVIRAMKTVPRHLFVPFWSVPEAYYDRPLPIGEGQTISQPYIVAFMSELLELKGDERVLEVGTGSGYQAAVLSHLCGEVYTIEIKPVLHKSSAARLNEGGYKNVHARAGDGYYGWEGKGPFAAIMITAAVDHIPPPLVRQLKEGGKLVLPLSKSFLFQTLAVVTKRGNKVEVRYSIPVRFVPMTGGALR